MLDSIFPNRLKEDDESPIIENDSLEDGVAALEITQADGRSNQVDNSNSGTFDQRNEVAQTSISNSNIIQDSEPQSILTNSISPINPNVIVTTESGGIENGENVYIDGSQIAPNTVRGRIVRYIVGNSLAFLSGLFFTANNFVIHGAKLSFGEVLAVRSIIQIPLMSFLLLFKGENFWPSSTYQRIMLCMLGLFGSLTMITSFASVKFMPVADAITLIFTSPLFTMILAAIFMKDKVTIIKTISGAVLMAGIVLVTKPSILFHNDYSVFLNESSVRSNASYDWRKEYQKEIILWFDPRTPSDDDPKYYYFIGAMIALSCSFFSAAIIIITTKLGHEIPKRLQLLYIGVFAFIIAGLVELLDEKDRFFSSDISKITTVEWGIYIGLSFSGMLGFLFEFKSCQMVPPATVATLRTTEIVVAFIAQSLLTNKPPAISDTLGASFVFLAALALIFEKHINNGLSKIFCNRTPPTTPHERLEEETSEINDA